MLKLGTEKPTRKYLEQQIAAISQDITILNEKIAEITELANQREMLRQKLLNLVWQYLKDSHEQPKNLLFGFAGKTKNLLEALQSEIQKAENYSPSV